MRAASIAALSLILAGCASSGQRMNVAAGAPPSDATALASDALRELVKLYPPAVTRLAIVPPASGDTFGQALADGLRKRGYAVVEASGKRGKGDADPSALSLRYVLDQPLAAGFYRLMLMVGGQSLTRGYSVAEAGVAPSAGWALNLSGASPELVERATRPDLPPQEALAQATPAPWQGVVSSASPAPSTPRYALASRSRHPRSRALAAKLAAYRSADATVHRMAAKVAADQANLVRAKAQRSVAEAGWRIQFAAFRTDRVAHQYWASLVQRRPALATLKPQFPRSGHGLTFVQAGPYQTVAFAKAACGGFNTPRCIVVKA